LGHGTRQVLPPLALAGLARRSCQRGLVSAVRLLLFASFQNQGLTMMADKREVVYGTEDLLISLCNSVTKVLNIATQGKTQYSGMVQRISKIGLKPDIGCFVLFDGGFNGLVVLNFEGKTAMEIYTKYMLNMGMPKDELASSHTSDEVSNILGELMNQIVGDFTGKIRRELQTNITQNQPKMLVLNKQVMLSVDTPLDRPEMRRVTFYTESNNIFYLELAIDRTEFIKLVDFDVNEVPDPDALIAMEGARQSAPTESPAPAADLDDNEALMRSLGM
jgi:CheY-specific phosphatase CheX